jgi:hypothetical protein
MGGASLEQGGAGADRCTLKGRRSSGEDEPAAKVVGDGGRRKTVRSLWKQGGHSRERGTR